MIVLLCWFWLTAKAIVSYTQIFAFINELQKQGTQPVLGREKDTMTGTVSGSKTFQLRASCSDIPVRSIGPAHWQRTHSLGEGWLNVFSFFFFLIKVKVPLRQARLTGYYFSRLKKIKMITIILNNRKGRKRKRERSRRKKTSHLFSTQNFQIYFFGEHSVLFMVSK